MGDECDITFEDVMREIYQLATFPREYWDLKIAYIHDMILLLLLDSQGG